MKAINEKQKEIIEHFNSRPVMGMKLTPEIYKWISKKEQLFQELSALEAEEKDELEEIDKFNKILDRYRHDDDFPLINAIIFTKTDILNAFDEYLKSRQ